MFKKISTIAFAFIISLSLLSPAFAADTITKTYKFDTNSKDNLSYNAPKEIKDGDKTYMLDEDKEIEYKIVKDNKISIKKNVKVKNKEDIKKEIVYKTENGKTKLHLKNGSIKWKSTYRSPKTVTKQYATTNEIPSSVASTVDENGKTINIKCNKSDVKTKSKTVSFSAPAKFYGYEDSQVFSFNGKKVKITGSNPVWNGYKGDVAEYLGARGNYTITGAAWTTSMRPYQDMYVREARFTGTKTVPFYEATFVETDDTRGMYEAAVTYEGIDTNQKIEAEANVTYKIVDTGLSTIQKVLIAAASILILIAVILFILFILKKRRKEDVN